jgi:hypothetical protein
VQLIRTRLQWVSAAALATIVCGCFNPKLLGTHCDAQGGCPSPYTCNANHVCLLAGPGGSGGGGGANDTCPNPGGGAGGNVPRVGPFCPTGSIPTGAQVIPAQLSYGMVGDQPTCIGVHAPDAMTDLFTLQAGTIATFSLASTVHSTATHVVAAPLLYPQGKIGMAVGTNLGVYILIPDATTMYAYSDLDSQSLSVDLLRSGFFHGGGVAIYEDVVAVVGADLHVWDATGVATNAAGYTERVLPNMALQVYAMINGRFHPDPKPTDAEDLLLSFVGENEWKVVPGGTAGITQTTTSGTVLPTTARPWTLTTIRRDASGAPDMVAVTNPNDQNLTLVSPYTWGSLGGNWPMQSRRLDGGVISAAVGRLCGGSPVLVLALQTGDIWILPTDEGALANITAAQPTTLAGQSADFVATAHITGGTGGPDDLLVHAIGADHVTVLTMTGCP